MAFPSFQPLPPSVEEMIQKICDEQCLPSPDHIARGKLSSLGQERSLKILEQISSSKIDNLSALIMYIAKRYDNASDGGSTCSSDSRFTLATENIQYESGSSTSSPKKPWAQTASPHMLALGELEFKKLFLILSYLGKKRLEDVLTMEMIRKLKCLPMAVFEPEVWKAVGSHFIPEEHRIKDLDRESNCTHLYCCDVDSDGKIVFKGPYLEKTRTHLQRVLGDENVLNVRFVDDAIDKRNSALRLDHLYASFYNLAKEGILVGLRLYRFFVLQMQ